MKPVRLALISGGMYDALYAGLPAFARAAGVELETAFCGDHVALNHALAQADAATRFDLVSTHSKYAPSQRHALAPLDDLLAPSDLADFQPSLLALARVDGRLLGLPRNLDARLLHYRTDLIATPPATWEELIALAASVRRADCDGFVFPGMESGLFGTFFELAEMGGATLFPADGAAPDLRHPGARWALQLLRAFYSGGLAPAALTGWHYDQVHAHFRAGRAALVGDWPGYHASYAAADSPVAGRFAVCAYPVGPSGRSCSYGGSHTFALTPAGAARPEALAALRFLTSEASQLSEARAGSVPVRASVMRTTLAEASPLARRRWEVLDRVIREGLLIPPKFPAYPALEEMLWHTVQQAMTGVLPIDDALAHMSAEMNRLLTPPSHASAL